MKKQATTVKSGLLPSFLRAICIVGLLPTIVLLFSIHNSQAASATWNLNPTTGDWNTAANWAPAGVPNGPADTATFNVSSRTGISLSADTEIGGIVFNPGASAFSTTSVFTLTISGAGITNNSGITQNFVTAVDGFLRAGTITFINDAKAESLTAFTNNGGTASGSLSGLTIFRDNSSAGNATFTNNADTVGFSSVGGSTVFLGTSTADRGIFTNNGGAIPNANGGSTSFRDTSTAGDGTFANNGGTAIGAFFGLTLFSDASTAGNATFTNNGGAVSGAFGGDTQFGDTSTAGNATFISNGAAVSGAFGGTTSFDRFSTAGNSTLIANGSPVGNANGAIAFTDRSKGGTARVEVFGNGVLDISLLILPSVTVGSIEGDGLVFLGARNLGVGSNGLSTKFSGVIQDGGIGGGTGGSFTKIGTGKLTLSNASTYTGGTTVGKGKLLVTNRSGSATGTGTVQVKAGTLGGTGTISGAIIVASGTTGAVLAPGGGDKPGTLTTLSALAFNASATYKIDLDSTSVVADKVVANGVTINGSRFSLVDHGGLSLTPGTVFTVIDNTAVTPISGIFANLADGSTFTAGSNTFQASYGGGDGNDLTLTVVP